MCDDRPKPACRNCIEYDLVKECCMMEWNNLDPDYNVPDRDKRDPDDCCDNYDWDRAKEED
jgi:hypothetical protein